MHIFLHSRIDFAQRAHITVSLKSIDNTHNLSILSDMIDDMIKTRKIKKLEIRCTGTDTIDWQDLCDLQVTADNRPLKVTDEKRIEKLAASLLEFGLVNNLQVWRDKKKLYCFDAHHRKKAFQLLADHGVEVPSLPATFCLAKNIEEAKQLLLVKESVASSIDKDTIRDYMAEIDMNVELIDTMLDLPGINMADFELAPDPIDASQQRPDLQYKIMIDCNNETHQAELLKQFITQGISCKALML